MAESRSRRPLVIGGAVVAALVVIAVVIPWIYTTFISDPPERLTLDDAPTTEATDGATDADGPEGAVTADDAGAIEGRWTVSAGSEAGYRVPEVLFGQETEAVGRTEEVTGELEVGAGAVESGSFTVALDSVTSDDDRRDGQFRGRIMDTAAHPTASFELTEPIELDEVPAEGEVVTATATGELTARGTTNPVTFPVEARRQGGTIEVNGSIPVVFADHGIPDPSFGPAVVGPEGEIEFLLVLARS